MSAAARLAQCRQFPVAERFPSVTMLPQTPPVLHPGHDPRRARPSARATGPSALAGAMSSFRLGGGCPGRHRATSATALLRASTVIDGVKCVIVNEACDGRAHGLGLRQMNFARDNELQVAEGFCCPRSAREDPCGQPSAAQRKGPCGPFLVPPGRFSGGERLILADRRLCGEQPCSCGRGPCRRPSRSRLGGLEDLGRLRLVATRHGLLDVLDDGAELRAQRGEWAAFSLTSGGRACGPKRGVGLLGFGSGGHGVAGAGSEMWQRPRV